MRLEDALANVKVACHDGHISRIQREICTFFPASTRQIPPYFQRLFMLARLMLSRIQSSCHESKRFIEKPKT